MSEANYTLIAPTVGFSDFSQSFEMGINNLATNSQMNLKNNTNIKENYQ